MRVACVFKRDGKSVGRGKRYEFQSDDGEGEKERVVNLSSEDSEWKKVICMRDGGGGGPRQVKELSRSRSRVLSRGSSESSRYP